MILRTDGDKNQDIADGWRPSERCQGEGNTCGEVVTSRPDACNVQRLCSSYEACSLELGARCYGSGLPRLRFPLR